MSVRRSEIPVLPIAVVAVLAGRYLFGFGWIGAVFSFWPVKGLVRKTQENDGAGMVRAALSLVTYPLVAASAPFVAERVAMIFADKARATAAPLADSGMGETLGEIALALGVKESALALVGAFNAVFQMVLLSAVTFGLFVAASLIVSVVSHNLTDEFSLPPRAHAIATKTIGVLSVLSQCLIGILAIRVVDVAVCALPTGVKLAAAAFLAVICCLKLRRVLAGDGSGKACRGKAPRSKSESLRLGTRPDVRLDDVVGMQEAKDQIRLRLIEPLRNPARARRYGLKVGGGILLYGPPGTGKTFLARAVAGELGLPFYTITPADVFGMYVGETEKAIRRIFADIRRNKLSVVFIDELETLFPVRTSDIHETTRKVVSLLLQELDGLDQSKNPILLLGATNVPQLVDPAFLRPGRFDVKIEVGLPDLVARERLLAQALRAGSSIPVESALASYLAMRTEGYSGADLKGLVERLKQLAYQSSARVFDVALADRALAGKKSSV